MCCADAARDIELPLHHILPESPAGGKHFLIPRQPCNIRHAAVKVDRTHRVSRRLRLLPDGEMCLMIPVSEFLRVGRFVRPSVVLRALLLLKVEIIRLRSPHIKKEFAKLQILLLAGQLIQLCECHLCDLMSGIALTLSVLRSEFFSDKVRKSLRRFQKLILAGRLIIGNRSLKQMSETVEFMVISEVGENAIHAVDNIVCVQIAVLRLCRTDDVDRLIRSLLKFGIGMVDQGITNRLDPL